MELTNRQVHLYLGPAEYVYAKVMDDVNMSGLARQSVRNHAKRSGVDLDKIREVVEQEIGADGTSGNGSGQFESIDDLIEEFRSPEEIAKLAHNGQNK
ncbi:hypothetical protein SAMN05216388_10534 [Halorientalis persicus]|uniref:Uncharacterized protein n=1 Tax=Halorientalis persicus TaxID=1367881 RepID=A0A1H8WA24_9EURY|nr:hypothetical protein [Halorientalis persicus]SEP24505.1 hypothetical protein SAMN05216388_10534 [Halorientalis persicus]